MLFTPCLKIIPPRTVARWVGVPQRIIPYIAIPIEALAIGRVLHVGVEAEEATQTGIVDAAMRLTPFTYAQKATGGYVFKERLMQVQVSKI